MSQCAGNSNCRQSEGDRSWLARRSQERPLTRDFAPLLSEPPVVRRGVLASQQAALARQTKRGLQPISCRTGGRTHPRAWREHPAAFIEDDA